MCTLIVAHRIVKRAPVAVIANRDEFLARPSVPPLVRETTPAVFCGLDDREGGTWFGLNEHGLVVGLTNLTLRPPDPTRRSRGLVCMDMLALRDVNEVKEALEALADRAYNPFNLVALDGVGALRVRYDDTANVETLAPGVYATTNWPVGSEADGKRRATEARLRGNIRPEDSPDELESLLCREATRHDGDGDPRTSVCCHAPGYGTRASTMVLMDPSGRQVRVKHADGPPCSSAYEDRTSEAAAMLTFNRF